MSDSDEESTPPFPPKSDDVDDIDARMDFDLDIYGSWPLDQIAFVSDPLSPLVFSSADLPHSPIWAFGDEDNQNKVASNRNAGL